MIDYSIPIQFAKDHTVIVVLIIASLVGIIVSTVGCVIFKTKARKYLKENPQEAKKETVVENKNDIDEKTSLKENSFGEKIKTVFSSVVKKLKNPPIAILSCVLVLALVFGCVFAAVNCNVNKGDGGDKVTLKEIVVTAQPEKTEYFVGEYFERTGMVITANFSDGTNEQVLSYTVDKTSPLKIDDTEVTVTYQGKTAKVKITVKEVPKKQLETLAMIESTETKSYRVEAEDLDLQWCAITTEVPRVEVPGVNVKNTSGGKCVSGLGTGGNEVGIKVVSTVSCRLSITICASYGNKDGMPFDSCITTFWNDKKISTETKVYMKNAKNTYWDWMTFTIEDLELQVGDNELWFKIASAAPNFDYFEFNVNPKEVKNITVEDAITEYRQYDTFDTTGMTVRINYEDGTSEVATEYDVEDIGALTEDTEVTVTCRKRTYKIPVKVGAMINSTEYASYKVEAEYMDLTGLTGFKFNNGDADNGSGVGGFVRGDEYKVIFSSEVAANSNLTMRACYGSKAGLELDANMEVYFNGTKIITGITVRQINEEKGWFDWQSYEIRGLSVVKGENVLSFKAVTDSPMPNFDSFNFVISPESVHVMATNPGTYRVEAEKWIIEEGSYVPETLETASGRTIIGSANGKFSFNVLNDVNKDTSFTLRISAAYGADINFDDEVKTYVNGKEIKTGGVISSDASNKWIDYVTFDVKGIELKMGMNKISFVVKEKPNFDYAEIIVKEIERQVYRFEAEDWAVEEGTRGTENLASASGGVNINNAKGKFSFEVKNETGKNQDFTLTISAAYGAEIYFDDHVQVFVNGTQIFTEGRIAAEAENKWLAYVTVDVAGLTLIPGSNKITFVVNGIPNFDYAEVKTLEALSVPHVHEFASDWTKDSTHHWHAATCGHDDAVTRILHVWDDGLTIKDATETEDGEKLFTCVCGQTKKVPIPAISHIHQYSSEWTYDETHHWHVTTCGHDDAISKAEHAWEDGVVTKEPTVTKKGEKTYACSCGTTKTETVDTIGVVNGGSYRFEAEDWLVEEGTRVEESLDTASGGVIIGNVNGTLSFIVKNTDAEAKTFTLTVSVAYGADINFDDHVKLYVNDTKITTNGVIASVVPEVGNKWFAYVTINVENLTLNNGVNVIKFVVNGKPNFDYAEIKVA